MKKLSLVIPCHNEQPAIGPLLGKLAELAAALPDMRLELVFVNDGSTDGTLDALLAAQAGYGAADVVVVDLSRNFGKEAALSAGLVSATGDAVVPMDADLQDPPELVPRMVEMWKEGAEVVLAHRGDRTSDPWSKRTGARLFYRMHNALSDVAVPPDVGDFRLMDRAVVDVLNRLPENHRFMKGLFAWAGFRSRTLDYTRVARVAGKSQFSTRGLWRLALEGLTSFSLAPLRIATVLGALAAIAALLQGTWILLRTMLFGVDLPGYASLFTAVVFLGGIQLVCLGIIGEYVGRTYLEAKGRPPFVIRRVYKGG